MTKSKVYNRATIKGTDDTKAVLREVKANSKHGVGVTVDKISRHIKCTNDIVLGILSKLEELGIVYKCIVKSPEPEWHFNVDESHDTPVGLTSTHRKVLEIYHNEGHVKAWNYWRLIGNTYGIFLGEVPSTDFIDGESLSRHIGLTKGKLCNINSPWLKFILDGNIIYVPMNPLRYAVSRNDIDNEGDIININGNNFNITLLHGLSGTTSEESEWNRLMYPIHTGMHDVSSHPDSSVPFNQWANYTDEDLGNSVNFGYGKCSWMREIIDNTAVIRGCDVVTDFGFQFLKHDYRHYGWRPALRMIDKVVN